ncbi:DUF2339 domain-containing protein [Marinihelvus fidelis]|uniref:DUF2339 domain-containing protein n=1 Tax=Marinihelvus fidelis TaxID=2613842 RepID=A0A5N0TI19_9GAMM|nr:DUF2339 domain-containing protein [Marinihelvus fidelis]KAA9134114.1 DUF2339 domain-containing protein [Marinihelvus fidelis]
MAVGLTIGGFIAGLLLMAGNDWFLAPIAGAGLGFLLGRLLGLEKRIKELQYDFEKLWRQVNEAGGRKDADAPAAATPPETKVPTQPATGPAEDVSHLPVDGPARDSVPELDPEPPAPESTSEPAATDPRPAARPPVFTPEAPPPYVQTFFRQLGGWLSSWFTTGNVPVKVGVILSFIGVAFFLKYAVDNELFSLPIEFRLLAVAAGGLAMVVVGWRLRHRLRVYSLSLQGGGVGVLFLVIFAALRIWQLLPAGIAFVLLVALTAFTCALSVLQKSRALIVLGAVGGFLAPVLASTGQGSHVTLFSYYLVLNLLIVAVAWFQAWRAVNLVGFVFTFVIGSLWGYHYYRPGLFASTEPFLVAHFVLYQVIAILYALRQPPRKIGLVDGTLVFGTPVIVFALQAALVSDTEYGLAISAAVLAVFYALTATWLHRRHGAALQVLRDSFLALAVAFATIAIPLALDAGWTATAWALEGAALIWLATRQPQHLANFAGATLIVFSGCAFVLHGWRNDVGWPVLNGNVLNGALISLAALFAARRLEHFRLPPVGRLYGVMAWGLFAWGVLWWLGTGVAEIDDRVGRDLQMAAVVLFLSATVVVSAWYGQNRDWAMARGLALLFLPALALLALHGTDQYGHFLGGLGWLAWPVAFVVQAWLVRSMDRQGHRSARTWHVGTVILLTLMVAVELGYQVGEWVSGAWDIAAASAVPGIAALVIWRFRRSPAWPVPAHPLAYFALSLCMVAGQMLYLGVVTYTLPGDTGPLPYMPVLNPFDLAVLFAGGVALLSLVVIRRDQAGLGNTGAPAVLSAYRLLLGATFLVLTTLALLRGVHHLAAVPWDADRLFDSVVAQTALSIYWGMLGFAGMVLGARRGQRGLWLAGAGFMALVVLKLFLVDLGNSGTIERIISFIGVGVLLLVVGYFAPAPPRVPEDES